MKLIVGLGNPGDNYVYTRHNCGFEVMDYIAEKLKVNISQNKFNSLLGSVKINNETVLLMKPLTYMNLSGEAVLKVVQYFKIKTEDILVIHDDLDLPAATMKIRYTGSAGGQKGMKNIIDLLKTQDIARIRIGIGKDKNIPVVSYVLGKLNVQEYASIFDKASDAAIAFIEKPISKVMSEFNSK